MFGIMVGGRVPDRFVPAWGVCSLFLAHPSLFQVVRLAGAGYKKLIS